MSDTSTRENLFERWDLDPGAGPQAITERLRELLLEAEPREQEQLRHAWETLTLHPRRRIAEALATYPETRAPLGRAPARLVEPREAPGHRPSSSIDRLVHAPVTAALGPPPPLPPALPRHDEDPLLARPKKTPSPTGGSP